MGSYGGVVLTRTVTNSRTITADWTSPVLEFPGAVGAAFDINISAAVDTPAVVFKIQAQDAYATTVYESVLESASKTGTGHFRMIVHPACAAVTNLIANQPLPKRFVIFADGTWAGTDSITFSIAATTYPS